MNEGGDAIKVLKERGRSEADGDRRIGTVPFLDLGGAQVNG